MTTDKITISTKGVMSPKSNSLISSLEGNFDLDVVSVKRNEYAIKSIMPLELLIEATTGFLLTKFVLEPAINAVAEKFDWKKAVAKYRNDFEPFNVVINLSADNVTIKTDPNLLSQKHIENVWEYIDGTIKQLEKEHIYQSVDMIRLVSKSYKDLFIVCHVNGKPAYLFDWEHKKLTPIVPNDVAQWAETPIASETAGLQNAEQWAAAQVENKRRYDEYRASLNK